MSRPRRPIEDYAVIGDTETAALVARDGSMDWLCLPRFDSDACFSSLLGDDDHGRWRIAPRDQKARVTRRYRDRTLVLETEFETETGVVRLVDFMPVRQEDKPDVADVVRIVEGVRGTVEMDLDLAIRFGYGSIVPWVTREDGRLRAVGGPDAVVLTSPVDLRGEGLRTVSRFDVHEGERVPFVLTWFPSYGVVPEAVDPFRAVDLTTSWWEEWIRSCTYQGEWEEAVERSLITLKALTYRPSGGVVAAATTSLPETLGGVRNWDYRFVWLRDATFTLYALMLAGFRDEAIAWRDWLLRAVAGDVSRLQIMYGIDGRRRLTEHELDWLPGYASSRPVRIGNAAYEQRQIDVYGEVMDALHYARRSGIDPDPTAWDLQRALLDWLEGHWSEPDNGLWEVRGAPRHFTHSRLMAWVAFDRGVQAQERFGLDGPAERWARIREEIRAEILREGFDDELNTFTQSYGSTNVDASLLMIPLVGFLPGDDPRVLGTIEAIQRELVVDGFVKRYETSSTQDGLPGEEGAFLLTTFWLVDALALAGRREEARQQFERLLSLRNDVGLLAEEYDPAEGRMLGNFPQAFSHVSLVGSAWNLRSDAGPGRDRPRQAADTPSEPPPSGRG